MTRNQKIALGCGGAGCLGLIIIVIAAGLIYFYSYSRGYSTSRNINVSTNRNSNLNDNSESTENDNSTGTSTSSSTAASLSNDDKHKLFQAANMTGDGQLSLRVQVKLGLLDDDYSPTAAYEPFVTEHVGWAIGNVGFIQSIRTPEKARAYVDEHLPE